MTTNTRIAGAQVGVEREFLHQWEEAAMAYRQGREVGLRCLGETHPLVQALSKSCEAVTGDLAFRMERSVEIEDYVNGESLMCKVSTAFIASLVSRSELWMVALWA